jgi:hypothetical protein
MEVEVEVEIEVEIEVAWEQCETAASAVRQFFLCSVSSASQVSGILAEASQLAV